MITLISVTKHFTVQPLLPIENERFAWWYAQGVWWALYGDCQGHGPCTDTYLIDNVRRAINNGWYTDLSSEQSTASGFYLGMIHGGTIEPGTHRKRQNTTIVNLTNPDFQNGYESGRNEPVELTDVMFMRQLQSYALSQPPSQVLAHNLGEIIGSLSTAMIPTTTPVTQPVTAL